MKKTKKLSAMLLAAVMLMSLIAAMPFAASAEEAGEPEYAELEPLVLQEAETYEEDADPAETGIAYTPQVSIGNGMYTVGSSRELSDAVNDLRSNGGIYSEITIYVERHIMHYEAINIGERETVNIYMDGNVLVLYVIEEAGLKLANGAKLNFFGPGRSYIMTAVTSTGTGRYYAYSGASTFIGGTTWVDAGNRYYFEDAVMVRGLFKQIEDDFPPYKKHWYYFKSGGEMAFNEMLPVNDSWYYFNDEGKMITSSWSPTIGGKFYYFGSDGKRVTGWHRIKDVWYNFGSDGSQQLGWQKRNDTYYLFDSNGYRVESKWESWHNNKGELEWSYLKANGEMAAKEWVRYGNSWYWLKSDGVMGKNEWVKWGDANYFLKPDGVMADNEWVLFGDTWNFFSAGGARVERNWVLWNGSWYYLKSRGVMAENEWLQWNRSWYYLKSGGAMAANENLIIGTREYTFNASGVCTNR